MKPELTIKQAHSTAVKLRKLIECTLPGVAAVDVDLELDEGTDPVLTIDNKDYFVKDDPTFIQGNSIKSSPHQTQDPSSATTAAGLNIEQNTESKKYNILKR